MFLPVQLNISFEKHIDSDLKAVLQYVSVFSHVLSLTLKCENNGATHG